jgi:hypothetical protein
MKRNVLIILIVLFLFQSCNFIEQRRKEKELENKILHEKIIEEMRRDSILFSEEKKVIGDIYFNISEAEFNIQKASFLDSCYSGINTYKYGNSKFEHEEKFYNIGYYHFTNMYPSFNNDSLFSVTITGISINVNDFESYMNKQFYRLFDILKSKYGDPFYNAGFPNYPGDKESINTICSWKIGKVQFEKKQIDIELWRSESICHLTLRIFLIDQVKKEVMELNSRQNEINKKAAEVL